MQQKKKRDLHTRRRYLHDGDACEQQVVEPYLLREALSTDIFEYENARYAGVYADAVYVGSMRTLSIIYRTAYVAVCGHTCSSMRTHVAVWRTHM